MYTIYAHSTLSVCIQSMHVAVMHTYSNYISVLSRRRPLETDLWRILVVIKTRHICYEYVYTLNIYIYTLMHALSMC